MCVCERERDKYKKDKIYELRIHRKMQNSIKGKYLPQFLCITITKILG